MISHEDFLKKLSSGVVFFINTFEGAKIKSVAGNGYFVKFEGSKEFKATNGSTIVTDGILEGKEITKKEYEK